MSRLGKIRAAFSRELERVQRGQGLRRGSRLTAVLHAIEQCGFPNSARGQTPRSYNPYDVRNVFEAARRAISTLQREMRVALLERHGQPLKTTTPLTIVSPNGRGPMKTAHSWTRQLAQRLEPQFLAWEADPDHRPAARRSNRERQAWREKVAACCLYRDDDPAVWDHVRDIDEAARCYAGERFGIKPEIVKRQIQRANRGF